MPTRETNVIMDKVHALLIAMVEQMDGMFEDALQNLKMRRGNQSFLLMWNYHGITLE